MCIELYLEMHGGTSTSTSMRLQLGCGFWETSTIMSVGQSSLEWAGTGTARANLAGGKAAGRLALVGWPCMHEWMDGWMDG